MRAWRQGRGQVPRGMAVSAAIAVAAVTVVGAAGTAVAQTESTQSDSAASSQTEPSQEVIQTEVRPVAATDQLWVEDASDFDWAGRGAGLQLGFGLWGDVGGNLEQVGRDLGFASPPGQLLTGFELNGWFAPIRRVRLGAWMHWYGDDALEGYNPTGAGVTDRQQQLTTRLRGGGLLVRYVWPWSILRVHAGVGVGLGDVAFSLERTRLTNPGSYGDYTDDLRTSTNVATFRRDFSAGGPLARGEGGLELMLADWLALGLRGAWTMHYIPAGNWVDDQTGGQLDGGPTRNIRGWSGGLYLSAGKHPGAP